MRKVLLYGPRLNQSGAAYGDGVGGATRNMTTYLNTFKSDEFVLVPSFYSVKKAGKWAKLVLPWRLASDVLGFISDLARHHPAAVHILAQYRGAIYREWVVAAICRYKRIPYVYGVKAGQFDIWYARSSFLSKYLTKSMLRHASKILCEGKRYVKFISGEFGLESVYWPNFVPTTEVTEYKEVTIRNAEREFVKVVFVGYCYDLKGIFDLVIALDQLSKGGVNVELDLLGHESPEFSMFLDSSSFCDNFKVNRHGKSSHQTVLHVMSSANIFCLPTRHPGEGHNNSINEAMMLGLPIICTRHGFLVDVLGEDAAIYIDDHKDIESAFMVILENPERGQAMAMRAKKRFQMYFHSDMVMPRLDKIYGNIVREPAHADKI